MKILLSAYACEPHKGSEPAVGWNWARTLARQGHQVHVLTRSNNRASIETAIAEQALPLAVSYYDLPAWCRRWKHWKGGLPPYYFLWQIGAWRVAKRLHAERRFDRVQHVTFALFRQPSFMGALGIPFIFGPVGGGETMPRQLRKGLPWRSRWLEILRNAGIAFVRWDPLMAFTYSRATRIACTTAETKDRIPARYHKKCVVLPTIGMDGEIDAIKEADAGLATAAGETSFLYVGRTLYWKGIHLAIRALAEARRSVPGACLKVIGSGDDLPWLKRVAAECGVSDAITWIPWMPHGEVAQEYRNHTAFAFPSLHDSGGMVVLEALSAGLPVTCLNLGGPGALVNSSCGRIIDATQADEAAVCASLAAAMVELAQDGALRARLASNCAARAREFTWERAVRTLYPAETEVE